jgi:hypothetical protein
MTTINVIVETIPFDDPHLNGKCVVLQGRWDQVPADQAQQHPTTIRDTIMLNALVVTPGLLQERKAHVIAQVREYVANYLWTQQQLKEL